MTTLPRIRAAAEREAMSRKSSATRKATSDLMLEHLYLYEKHLGRRLTPIEIRAPLFTDHRAAYVKLWLPVTKLQ